MQPVEIKKGIYWVGGVDWRLRNFHGYLTQRGSTYNAFLIVDEKITLVDTVKHYLAEEMISRIAAIVDPAKIDYIIANHVEMDHSGAIPAMMKIAPNAQIICSPKGEEGLRLHYGDLNYRSVKTGETLSLGSRTLSFVQTPMVHWPDNMISYCPEDKILFSNDAFGQHLATSERFDDEYPISITMEEAAKYYANIVLPFGNQVRAALKATAGFDIEIIAPSHGLIWRGYIPQIIENYVKWSNNETVPRAVIIYDTMWESTEKIAKAIQSGFESKGISTAFYNAQDTHISDIMTTILSARYICIGSPTLNNSILATVAGFLSYFKGLAPKGRIGMAFGSYGWSGQSVDMIEDDLKKCGFNLMAQAKIRYIPSQETLDGITASVVSEINRLALEAPSA